MKKLTTILLALLLGLLAAAPAWAFSDVQADKDDPQAAAISRVSELGIMTGYADGTFKPSEPITRAEFAKVAVLAAEHKLGDKIPMTLQENHFPDVVEGAWYVNNINRAVNMGLMKGDAEGTFRPNDTVSEDEILTVMLRMLGYNVDNDDKKWPDNYWELADNLGTEGLPEYVGKHDGSKAKRGIAAMYLSWALDLPAADDEAGQKAEVAAYGVVRGLTDSRITIDNAVYRLNGYDFGKDKPEVGRLVRYEANKAGELLALDSKDILTNDLHEAAISDNKIELNKRKYALAKDAEIVVMNSGGGLNRVSAESLLQSTYAASLRSARYYVPIQYVLADNEVKYLLIGDYAGQSELRFGFIEEVAEGADGTVVKFYGDANQYDWNPPAKNDSEPQEDTLYAYVLKADGVSGYAVDTAAEQIKNAVVKQKSGLMYTAGGEQFIVDEKTVIMKVEYDKDGAIKHFYSYNEVEVDDIVRVRYREEKNSKDTGIEAAYIIIDATDE